MIFISCDLIIEDLDEHDFNNFFSKEIRKRNMTKSIFLNAKINEIIKTDAMKSEYRDAADVKIKKIVTSINMIVKDRENE